MLQPIIAEPYLVKFETSCLEALLAMLSDLVKAEKPSTATAAKAAKSDAPSKASRPKPAEVVVDPTKLNTLVNVSVCVQLLSM